MGARQASADVGRTVHLLGLTRPGRASRTAARDRSVRRARRVTEAATASTRPATARSWATVTALTMAVADDEPWLMTQTPSTPSSMAPPVFSGSRFGGQRERGAGSRTSAASLASSVGPKTLEQGVR